MTEVVSEAMPWNVNRIALQRRLYLVRIRIGDACAWRGVYARSSVACARAVAAMCPAGTTVKIRLIWRAGSRRKLASRRPAIGGAR